MTEVWTTWEGEVINEAFPLRSFLIGSDHSGVFLTQHNAQNLADAAIKIVAADPSLTETQLSNWRTAAALSHPHLIRLLDLGRSQLKGHPFLFVVMEYAEQTLSQILPHRALTPDEVREMLLPTLDALAFLHRQNLVHGQLKPPNFLVVDDQLKLSSDNIRPAGEFTTRTLKSSVYDPPEAKNGRISTAGDIWALGVTMIEALTQCPPAWSDQRSETPSLPTSLPPTLVEILRRCLSRNPADRPTAVELEAQIKGAPPAPVISVPTPTVPPAGGRPTARDEPPKQSMLVATATVLLMILVIGWAVWRLLHRTPEPQQPLSSVSQTSSQSTALPATDSQIPQALSSMPPEVSARAPSTKSAASKPSSPPPLSHTSDRAAQPSADASPAVLHKEVPEIPRSARDTIRGHFSIAVRVTVDSFGNVVAESLEKPGPSKYFARLASAAAKKWKFAPADTRDSRQCLISFDFSRSGASGHATVPRS